MSNQSNLSRAIHFVREEINDDERNDNVDADLYSVWLKLIKIKTKRYDSK